MSPGRPIGLHPHHVAELAGHRIHLHFYGEITHGQWLKWIEKTQAMAPGMNLSSAQAVRIEARVSRSGNASPQPGDLVGTSGVVKPGARGLRIVVDKELP